MEWTEGSSSPKLGFQSGAHDAARNTAVVLQDFDGFMDLFFGAWLSAMSVRLHKASDRLVPFFDVYWFESLPELPQDKFQLFDKLRIDYRVFCSLGTWIIDGIRVPVSTGIIARNPDIVAPLMALSITSYRQFFDVLLAMADRALADFCSLFGLDPACFSDRSLHRSN